MLLDTFYKYNTKIFYGLFKLQLFFKKAGHPPFMFIFVLFKQLYRIKTVSFNGIRTRIVRVEVDHHTILALEVWMRLKADVLFRESNGILYTAIVFYVHKGIHKVQFMGMYFSLESLKERLYCCEWLNGLLSQSYKRPKIANSDCLESYNWQFFESV